MENVMIILFLVCFVCLIIGLIKPSIVVRWGIVEKRNRKSVLKYYGIGLIVAFILVGIFAPKTSNTTDKSTTAQADNTVKEQPKEKTEEEKNAEAAKQKADEEAKAKADAEAKAAAEKDAKKIKSGTYKVGSDIPAGEYLVIAKSMGYIECAKDSKGQLDSIVFNDNLKSGSNSYVTVNEGEYFKMTGAEMYPVAEAPSIVPKDGIYKDGMYKVGQDIPAGEYKVKLTGSIGYTEVSQNSRHQLDSIVSNENVQADGYLTVENGQYLKISEVQIQK
ncbi:MULTISPECIES: hypothetical protein [unclassified Clostridium]|uniref:hypothetical protein n=1 Tax=unclassified Clostridium TaxID=2614128 RepID=UPI00029741ED|nr:MULTISPECIES: hypothetical protein [unclassified Clostridium]EKQ53278.1 MAG: hypothetical protein A370_03795 [Clostridium sp. Maddingley MBC34-26]